MVREEPSDTQSLNQDEVGKFRPLRYREARMGEPRRARNKSFRRLPIARREPAIGFSLALFVAAFGFLVFYLFQ